MTFQVRIQNLGKLADATVRVGGLTVLAGVNNTGKTFFSKSLYSVFEALNVDHLMVEFNVRANPLREKLRQLTNNPMFASSSLSLVTELVGAVDRMELVAKECFAKGDLVFDPKQEYPALKEAAEKMLHAYKRLESMLDHWAEQKQIAGEHSAVSLLFNIGSGVRFLHKLGGMTAGEIVAIGFQFEVLDNIFNNFQTQHGLSDLGSRKDVTATDLDDDDPNEWVHVTIDINGKCFFCFGESFPNGIDPRDFPVHMLLQLRRRANVFFLESPVMWRLKGVLESALLDSRNGRVRSDVPEYFRKLLAALMKRYSGEMPFPEVYRRLTEEVIGGRIVQNDLGELRFAESGGGNYALSMTATGVVNLGILALLIEKKLVDKGAFLFIDEPESNLHPEWQVAMTEALWELARGGVKVLIATHSIDILKRLEIYAKEKDTKEDAANLIAVNHFQRDGTVQSGGVEKIRDIKRDLSAPFFKLYKRGLS